MYVDVELLLNFANHTKRSNRIAAMEWLDTIADVYDRSRCDTIT